MYKITVVDPDGHFEILEDLDLYALTRSLDKCEIRSFKVELKPISDK